MTSTETPIRLGAPHTDDALSESDPHPAGHATYFTYTDSPVGPLMIAATAHGLRAIEFAEHRHPVPRTNEWVDISEHPYWRSERSANQDHAGNTGSHLGDSDLRAAIDLLTATAAQLAEYFAGERRDFQIPLDPIGTDFQCQVWQGLQQIPYGQTWSYADLARHIGNPKAVRAVGAANGRNPISIVVPCHRVIAADGTLGGYGGGLQRKTTLLRIEGHPIPESAEGEGQLF
ncbi:MAG: methylated-DNA--[protein]-cysteine S-methyltransferase [Actinomycetaceae bacterium]|nr:methylated-DNA--[protein]-cysteine S-methyltransferase [Actinomycetaceae bacterium]